MSDSSLVISIDLSLIVPLYNEEENIDYLFQRLLAVLDSIGMSYEIICINDGSRDRTWDYLLKYHQKNPAIKVINLSRNFGKEIALTAGLDHAAGQAIIPIDADLQDPPELIAQMIAKWQEGYEAIASRGKLV